MSAMLRTTLARNISALSRGQRAFSGQTRVNDATKDAKKDTLQIAIPAAIVLGGGAMYYWFGTESSTKSKDAAYPTQSRSAAGEPQQTHAPKARVAETKGIATAK
mmetsp:Transcript_20655/g.62246  ORF Transcript_20655/g.62246 Transcript_20655/m.62246 type:complete len:105 (+) Transcript_20655:383-697(+)|eukprot:CAMPEP_0206147240 /NCGR_PEP_ID=MMETSP1473-20131121/32883_1 /ASSEMBLY_ACC=CAM_ASM_001109 /TAXON_ID=1461547 /ORGANISM="Stichococcus sp, Strain RCC1054" /LENGTH=104 /DNA_ID=CAMNT_0053544107 /DNA_START=363 /DNA_END=677 /DNA_ORIENTATION=+